MLFLTETYYSEKPSGLFLVILVLICNQASHQFNGFLELSLVSHDGERVEDVNEGERVIAQNVVDVDVRGVGIIRTSTLEIRKLKIMQQ